jgi:glucokinase
MAKKQLAIDLGGTKIASAIFANNTIIARDYLLTLAQDGVNQVISRLIMSIERLLKESGTRSNQLESICIASAGIINMNKGIVTVSPNLPGWYNVPLRRKIKEHFDIETYLLNDASAAALGEYQLGAGKKSNILLYITVSTGIGGGLIINKELYLGSCGSAGEIGHMSIMENGPLCYCGNRGCLETLASGTAIAKEAKRLIKEGKKTIFNSIVQNKVESITAKKVSLAAKKGDVLSKKIVFKAATYLGIGVANVINLLNPDMIIIGGSVSKIGEPLLEPVRQQVLKQAFNLPAQAVSIVPSNLGDDASIIGAALFAQQHKDYH